MLPESKIASVWSALFWITLLSVSVNVITKSFSSERLGRGIYLYSIVSGVEVIFSKIIYGFLISLFVSVVGFILFASILSNPIQDYKLFLLTLCLVSYGLSASLSILSAIASKTKNSNVIMAVLSFPVVISIILEAIQITKNCIDGLDMSASYDEIILLSAINILVTSVSYLLFPYIWRS